MIIIEGCDNSGKSTLAKKLSDALELPVIHSTRPPLDTPPYELLKHVQVVLEPRATILDRVFPISEYIYGRVLRGGSLLQKYQTNAFMELYNRPYLIIYCRPSDRLITEKNGRDQMNGVSTNFPQLISEYDFLMDEIEQLTKGRVLRYDYTSRPSYSKVLWECQDYLKKFNSGFSSATFLSQHRGSTI